MPSNLTGGQHFGIKIEGDGGQLFTNWSRVDFQAKSASILVQTDKAIYKPGQTSKPYNVHIASVQDSNYEHVSQHQ